MSEPFLAEIRMFSFQFAPKGWALCNGQLLPINENQALFALLGATFGGDARVNFGLPDLRGRVPLGAGQSYSLGERSGEQAHLLSIPELTQHTHRLAVSSQPGLSTAPGGRYPAISLEDERYTRGPVTGALAAGSVTNTGGSQAHLNLQPFLVISYAIALQGIFPSPN